MRNDMTKKEFKENVLSGKNFDFYGCRIFVEENTTNYCVAIYKDEKFVHSYRLYKKGWFRVYGINEKYGDYKLYEMSKLYDRLINENVLEG